MIIFLAPHLEYPTRNGGDIYVDQLGSNLSRHRHEVLILGVNTLTQYNKGKVVRRVTFSNSFRSKHWAAIRTLTLGTHYFVEKFLTQGYREMAKKVLADNNDATVVCSLISTASLEHLPMRKIVLTQNDEIAWFQNQIDFSVNPVQKKVALISRDWITRFLKKETSDLVFAHITDSDFRSYQYWSPEHLGFVVPAGVQIQKSRFFSNRNGILRLLFVGSLNVKMNHDALIYFKDKFWAVMKRKYQQGIEMVVLGSRPTKAIRRLCLHEGWHLIPDASEEELKTEYKRATFGVLPFPYTNGAKVKLLNMLAEGLPVLATENIKTSPTQEFFPNLYSDSPVEWSAHLSYFQREGVTVDQRMQCVRYASGYRWERIAEKMNKKLLELGI